MAAIGKVLLLSMVGENRMWDLVKRNKISMSAKLCGKGVELEKHIVIGKRSIVSDFRGGVIHINDRVSICNYCKILSCGGNIIIGKNSQIGDFAIFTGQGDIVIGNNVVFADKVNLIANEHEYKDINKPAGRQGDIKKAIEIGDDCWIGINVTVLGGSKIGKHCIVGANSLVKGEFDDYSVIAGNPARVIKQYVNDTWVNINKL